MWKTNYHDWERCNEILLHKPSIQPSVWKGYWPPQSIGDNYYCDSGDTVSNDPLWDGQQCENNYCTGPPGTDFSRLWFSVLQLPAPTIDVIEVSIYCDQGTNDKDTPLKLNMYNITSGH